MEIEWLCLKELLNVRMFSLFAQFAWLVFSAPQKIPEKLSLINMKPRCNQNFGKNGETLQSDFGV